MHPIERLRHVARAGDADASLLAEEAAGALGTLGFEPRALVPATRRLLEFHPTCGPLWWVCARLLCAEDPTSLAVELADELADDPTSDELAAALPGAATVLTTGGRQVISGLVERPDLTVRLMASPIDLRYELRRLSDAVDVTGYLPEEIVEALAEINLLVVEADAVGGSGAVVSAASARLIAAAPPELPIWVVAGCGRMLPDPLFSVLCQRLGRPTAVAQRRVLKVWDDFEGDELDGDDVEESERVERLVPLDRIEVLVGPNGPQTAAVALASRSCPVPTELLVASSDR